MADKSLELYVHIPFCVRKCEYCDFLSAPAGADTQQEYVRNLLLEIEQKGVHCTDYEVITIFFGGGTPSILKAGWIADILDAIHRNFKVRKDAEITIECNPGTLTFEKLSIYKSAGINRISVGLQSASDAELRELGRIHTYEDFLKSYDLIRKKGFSNINIDLMAALPGQTLKSYEQTLRRVLALKPEHISAYSLIIEEGTPFYEKYEADELLREKGEKPQMLPSEETERLMYERTKELLLAHGYERYEISNYARRGYACRHNIGYWRRENYLGFGLGSASLLENERFHNTTDLTDYLGGDYLAYEQEKLDKKSQMEEFMFLGLRMTDGISTECFRQTFGLTVELVYLANGVRAADRGSAFEKRGWADLPDRARAGCQ